MPGRKFSAGSGYRYGFNGKENDKDAGEGNLDFGARIYNSRLGKFLSIDPFTSSYPKDAPYNFAGNNPIQNIDVEGMFKLSAKTAQLLRLKYPKFYAFITSKDGIASMAKSPTLISAFKKIGWSAKDLENDFTYNSGPVLEIFSSIPSVVNDESILGQTPKVNKGKLVKIRVELLDILEQAISGEDIEAALLSIEETVIHEEVHVFNLVKVGLANRFSGEAGHWFNEKLFFINDISQRFYQMNYGITTVKDPSFKDARLNGAKTLIKILNLPKRPTLFQKYREICRSQWTILGK